MYIYTLKFNFHELEKWKHVRLFSHDCHEIKWGVKHEGFPTKWVKMGICRLPMHISTYGFLCLVGWNILSKKVYLFITFRDLLLCVRALCVGEFRDMDTLAISHHVHLEDSLNELPSFPPFNTLPHNKLYPHNFNEGLFFSNFPRFVASTRIRSHTPFCALVTHHQTLFRIHRTQDPHHCNSHYFAKLI